MEKARTIVSAEQDKILEAMSISNCDHLWPLDKMAKDKMAKDKMANDNKKSL